MKTLFFQLIILLSLNVSAQKYGMLHVQLDHYSETCKVPFELYMNDELIGKTDIGGFYIPSKKLKGELFVSHPTIGSTKQEVNLNNKKDFQTIYFPTTKAFQDSMFKKLIEADEHLSELMECDWLNDSLGPPPSEIPDNFEGFLPAEFPGGKTELNRFIAENIHFPEIARELGLQGKLVLNFRIDENGMISCIKLVKGVPDCPECDLEGLRVISKLPQFIPGSVNGKKVASYFTLPIHFKLT